MVMMTIGMTTPLDYGGEGGDQNECGRLRN